LTLFGNKTGTLTVPVFQVSVRSRNSFSFHTGNELVASEKTSPAAFFLHRFISAMKRVSVIIGELLILVFGEVLYGKSAVFLMGGFS